MEENAIRQLVVGSLRVCCVSTAQSLTHLSHDCLK